MPDFREEIRARLARLRIAPAREEEIVDELTQHLDDEYRDARARGLSDDEASREAIQALTDDTLAAALAGTGRVRSPQTIPVGAAAGSRFANLAQDFRFGLRLLAARPAFTAAAVLLVGLGIAATATIFSVVNTVLLKPLPYPESDRLVSYWGTAPAMELPKLDLPDGEYVYHRQHTRTLESVALYDQGSMTLVEGGEAERVAGGWISYNFFTVFRVPPALGRTFTLQEERPNGGLVVILSDALWRQRFGADSSIVGTSIRLNDLPTTVVGVMPPGFEYPERSRLWVPLRLTGNTFNCWCFNTVARLRDGSTIDDVRREMERLSDDLAISRPDIYPGAKPGSSQKIVMSLTTRLAGDVRTPLIVLLASVGLVLLIGCANVANLMLARAAQRTRELAIRSALGASAHRIRSQLMTEAALVLLLGLTTGLVVTWWSLRLIRTLPGDRISRIDQVSLDPVVLAFALGMALVAGLVCAVVPALRASRVNLQSALRDGARSSGGPGHRRTTDVFVVMQLALSLVLLSGAGLMMRSFRNIMKVDTGYETEHVLTARIGLPYQRYPNDTLVRQFMQRAIERVEALPGVSRVGAVNRPPLTPGNPQNIVLAEGHQYGPNEPKPVSNIRLVTPGYFEAIGTPIATGRAFTAADGRSAPRVAIVDAGFASRYWPGENAIGKRVRQDGDTGRNPWMTIVGVVPTIKHDRLDEAASLQVYQPFEQVTSWSMYFVVRSSGTPESLIPAMRGAVKSLDPALPLYDVITLEKALARTLVPRRLTNGLLTGFAVAAMLLAAIGIYGVMSLNVNGRFREFGVRLALGAAPADVLKMVVRGGAKLAIIGVLIGAVVSWFATPLLRDLLFQVAPRDALTLAAMAALLSAVAMLACYVPARRAMRADPTEALRTD